MKKYFFVFALFFLTEIIHAGKFDGVYLGAGVGANIASLKEKSTTESIKQFGANGKIYAGIGKSLLDTLFIGAEGFARYSFFVKQSDIKEDSLEGAPQFGGCLKAGFRPTENLLFYGLYGVQTSATKIKNAFNNILEPDGNAWTSMIGIGGEYAFGLGSAVRIEGLYEPENSFKIKDIPAIEYNTCYFSINLGLVVYL